MPLRPELLDVPLPPRLRTLPVDARGYPVPWFVPWLADGTPEFRGMDVVKWARAVRESRCFICGESLGRWLTFPIGPMCGVNRTTAEPPSHLECATWSARHCPFLSRPHAQRRKGGVADAAGTLHDMTEAPGFGLTRNPGVTLVWTTKSYRIFRAPIGGQANGARLIEIGPPAHVEWYTEGRAATRDEVEHAVVTGLPALEAMCEQERNPVEARVALATLVHALTALYPRP